MGKEDEFVRCWELVWRGVGEDVCVRKAEGNARVLAWCGWPPGPPHCSGLPTRTFQAALHIAIALLLPYDSYSNPSSDSPARHPLPAIRCPPPSPR